MTLLPWPFTRAHLAAVFAVAGSSCAIPPISCELLAAEASRCDLQPSRLRCDRLEPLELAEFATNIRDRECSAFRSDDASIDSRACRAFDWDCPASIAHHTAEVTHPRGAIVFVGGIDDRDPFDWSESLIDRVAARTRATTRHVSLPSWQSTTVRTRALATELRRVASSVRESRLHLICYAVGGIDCRSLVSPGGALASDPALREEMVALVASITTIATPHRGTDVADAALGTSIDRSNDFVRALVGGAGALTPRSIRDVLAALTREAATERNDRVVDAPGIFYQSFAGVSYMLGRGGLLVRDDDVRRACVEHAIEPLIALDVTRYDAMSEPLLLTAPFASRATTDGGQTSLTPSDGMVSVASAQWGVFRGCLPADHYDVIGQFDDVGPDPRTGFEAVEVYARIVDDLAERGL